MFWEKLLCKRQIGLDAPTLWLFFQTFSTFQFLSQRKSQSQRKSKYINLVVPEGYTWYVTWREGQKMRGYLLQLNVILQWIQDIIPQCIHRCIFDHIILSNYIQRWPCNKIIPFKLRFIKILLVCLATSVHSWILFWDQNDFTWLSKDIILAIAAKDVQFSLLVHLLK